MAAGNIITHNINELFNLTPNMDEQLVQVYEGMIIYNTIIYDQIAYILPEYTIGKYSDADKVMNDSKLVFYCDICTIQDNKLIEMSNNKYKFVPNLYDEHNHLVSLNEHELMITLKLSSNHFKQIQIVATQHIPLITLLFNKSYVHLLYKILVEYNNDYNNIIGCLSLNYSRSHHANFQLTKFRFPIQDVINHLLINREPVNQMIELGMVKGRMIAHKNFKAFYHMIFSCLLSILQIPDRKLSANIMYINRMFVMVFYVSPNNISDFNPSMHTLYTNDHLLLMPIDLYYTIPDFGPIDHTSFINDIMAQPLDTLTSEYSHILLYNDACTKLQILSQQEIHMLLDNSCVTRDISCNEGSFDVYRTILTKYLRCRYRNATELYNYLHRDVGRLYKFVISGELAYANKYQLNKDKPLALQGNFANYLTRYLVTDLIKLVPQDGVIRINSMIDINHALSIQHLNSWIHNKEKFGAESTFGLVFRVRVDVPHIEGTNFIIKVPRFLDQEQYSNFEYEYANGLQINRIREKIPNFVLTLGGFVCPEPCIPNPDPQFRGRGLDCSSMKDTRSFCEGGEKLPHIILEYLVNSITLSGYISNQILTNHNDDSLQMNIMCVIQQLMCALSCAQQMIEFVHYDLHTQNVLMYKMNTNNVGFIYRIGGQEYRMYVPGLCTIIDYGKTHTSQTQAPQIMLDNVRDNETYGYSYNQFKPYADTFKLISLIYVTLLGARPSLFLNVVYGRIGIDNVTFRQDMPIHTFFDAFWTAYNYKFINGYQGFKNDVIGSYIRHGDQANMWIIFVRNIRNASENPTYLRIGDLSPSVPFVTAIDIANFIQVTFGDILTQGVTRWMEWKL